MVSLRARLAAIPMNRLFLFLDFDGTLTPIVSRPNRARLNRTVRETLRKLVGLLPVVIISGRVPKDLRRRVGLQTVCYVGHHGLSCLEAGGDTTWLTTPPHRTLVLRWVQALRIAAEGIEGAFVEDKGVTVALHDRLVKLKQRSRLRRRAGVYLPRGSREGPSVFYGEIACWKPDPPARGTKAQRCRSCFGGHGHVIECRSILGTIIRVSTPSPWYTAEDLRFESADGVTRSVKMPGYLTPRNSTQFWTGWQQDNSMGKPISIDGSSVTQGYSEP